MKNTLYIAFTIVLIACSSSQPITIAKLPSGTTTIGILSKEQKPNIVSADYQILSSSIKQDSLFIDVQYSGGCNIHEFHAYINGKHKETIWLNIIHNNNGDACRALKQETLWYDLSTLKAKKKNELSLILNSGTDTLRYTY